MRKATNVLIIKKNHTYSSMIFIMTIYQKKNEQEIKNT